MVQIEYNVIVNSDSLTCPASPQMERITVLLSNMTEYHFKEFRGTSTVHATAMATAIITTAITTTVCSNQSIGNSQSEDSEEKYINKPH